MSIDWSKAPEGATHFQPSNGFGRLDRYFKDDFGSVFVPSIGNGWVKVARTIDRINFADAIPRPTSTEKPVDWSAAPFDATHAAFLPDIQQHIFFKFADDRWFDVKNKEWSCVGGKPNFDLIERPKTITQVVFDGLPSKYRWASVSNNGTGAARVYCGKPFLLDGNEQWMNLLNDDWCLVGDGYDTTNWQNSLIERQDVSSRVEQLQSVEAARQVEKDPVNNPSHHTTGGIECIDAMQAMLSRDEFIGYLRGNVFKYQWRYKHKNGIEDLKKAQWYANRLIELESAK